MYSFVARAMWAFTVSLLSVCAVPIIVYPEPVYFFVEVVVLNTTKVNCLVANVPQISSFVFCRTKTVIQKANDELFN